MEEREPENVFGDSVGATSIPTERPGDRAERLVTRVGPDALKPTAFETKTTARLIFGVGVAIGVAMMVVTIRAMLSASPTAIVFLLVGLLSFGVAIYVIGMPSKWRRQVAEPVGLLFVWGCTWEEASSVVKKIQERSSVQYACKAYIESKRKAESEKQDGSA